MTQTASGWSASNVGGIESRWDEKSSESIGKVFTAFFALEESFVGDDDAFFVVDLRFFPPMVGYGHDQGPETTHCAVRPVEK